MNKEDYLKLKAEKRVIQCVIFIIFIIIWDWRGCSDGAYAQFNRSKGPLETNLRTQLRA